MITSIIPKLPMRDKSVTKKFYIDQLGFADIGSANFDGYLLLKKDQFEIHFFEFKDLNPEENYGQIYLRTNDIETLYISVLKTTKDLNVNSHIQTKPWGQKEFSLLDPDSNLLTFGETI